MIFLSNTVIVFLFIEAILLILLTIAFVNVIAILKSWNFESTSPQQYRLEKRSYLVILIILFTLGFKVIMLPYFAYMVDALSSLVPGAMCAAGVISSNIYGDYLLILKVSILFLIGIWLILNRMDLNAKNYPYFHKKLYLFIAIFLLVIVESVLDLIYLDKIVTKHVVSCCSAIFGTTGTENPLPLQLDIKGVLALFYLLYVLSFVTAYYKLSSLSFLANAAYLYIAYYALVYFFGTYIYELPTHLCPYCMLQSEYYYVGYLIWGSLFLGTFFGMSVSIVKLITKQEHLYMYKASWLLNTLFMLLCSGYVIRYYLTNGVLL
jgi:hypothetical protein